MEAGVELDYTQYGRSGAGLTHTHAQASAQVQAFLEEVKSYGQPWGMNNAVGQTIGMCYEMALELIKECLQSNLEDYSGYPADLRTMAANHRSGEAQSAALFEDSMKSVAMSNGS